jgi:hypothetical protein
MKTGPLARAYFLIGMGMKVFLDTEFSNFEQPSLISIGLLTEKGDTFYAEMPAATYLQRCSTFVVDAVLPQLGRDPSAFCAPADLARRLESWLNHVRDGQNVKICVDYWTDWNLVCAALGFRIPDWCSVRNVYRDIDELKRQDFYLQNDVAEHHALHDACANRFAYRQSADRPYDLDAKAALAALPEVFTLSDIQVPLVEVASSMVEGWCRNGYASPAGHLVDVGIFYNHVRCPVLSSAEQIQALYIRHPEAILIGESVLHAVGCITQRPARLSVAALDITHSDELGGFCLHCRTEEWFRTIADIPECMPAPWPIYGMTSLHPVVALADLYADPTAWHPDWDDLDIDEIDAELLVFVFESFGVKPPEQLKRLLAKMQYGHGH